MNLPNRLTILRIILTIFIIILLVFPFYTVGVSFPSYEVSISGSSIQIGLEYIISGVLFILASVTDFLDGYIARRKKLITDTGKILDAIADKFLVNTILIILATANYINVIVPIIIVGRDVIVDAIKTQAAAKGIVVAAINSGKIKTAAMLVGITLKLFSNMPFEFFNLNVDDFLIYFATIMSIVSMFEYIKLGKKIILTKE